MKISKLGIGVVALLAFGSAVKADTLLGLTVGNTNLYSNSIEDDPGNSLGGDTYNGYLMTFNVGATTYDNADNQGGNCWGDFSLALNQDDSAGTLTIMGTLYLEGTSIPSSTPSTLLSGNLVKFAESSDDSQIQMLFTPTGGSLENQFPQGIGVILHTVNMDADTIPAAAPLPASLPTGAFLLGSVGMIALLRKTRAKTAR